jgi:phospholipase/carboxylesterase
VLQTALRHPERLAGVMALSTYLPLSTTLEKERHKANHDVPIFMAHGKFDDIIPIDKAKRSREILEKLGYPVTWKEYPMPHSVCAEEIGDISKFLVNLL